MRVKKILAVGLVVVLMGLGVAFAFDRYQTRTEERVLQVALCEDALAQHRHVQESMERTVSYGSIRIPIRIPLSYFGQHNDPFSLDSEGSVYYREWQDLDERLEEKERYVEAYCSLGTAYGEVESVVEELAAKALAKQLEAEQEETLPEQPPTRRTLSDLLGRTDRDTALSEDSPEDAR